MVESKAITRLAKAALGVGIGAIIVTHALKPTRATPITKTLFTVLWSDYNADLPGDHRSLKIQTSSRSRIPVNHFTRRRSIGTGAITQADITRSGPNTSIRLDGKEFTSMQTATAKWRKIRAGLLRRRHLRPSSGNRCTHRRGTRGRGHHDSLPRACVSARLGNQPSTAASIDPRMEGRKGFEVTLSERRENCH